jgi:hypothetical protein
MMLPGCMPQHANSVFTPIRFDFQNLFPASYLAGRKVPEPKIWRWSRYVLRSCGLYTELHDVHNIPSSQLRIPRAMLLDCHLLQGLTYRTSLCPRDAEVEIFQMYS